ncbi:gamma carbonic anhydrase family protein [Sandarakinorhabdus sp. DWP1-3-1]|uniref:gamma carbonic anhydrase family protein n=1 Tax=Sandarakinorhabdus sp. DWP1-3-1 TaxID=2804627 RepID=UPI003CF7D98A
MTSYPFGDTRPSIADTAFVAPGARIIGNVTIGEDSSIWYNCVLRGDVEAIIIGARSNIQDGSVIHVSGAYDGSSGPTIIGDDVLVGHLVMLHACTIENHGFIGMGAIVMDACVVQEGGMLAAGAMLTPGKTIGRGELWAGRPAKFLRMLTEAEVARNRYGASGYVRLAKMHKGEGSPPL